jgi:putative aldouronate transport system substrate-binding protein
MTKSKSIVVLLMAITLILSACSNTPSTTAPDGTTAPAATTAAPTASASTQEPEPSAAEKPVITFTAPYFSAEVPDNEQVNQAITDISGYDFTINWTPSTAYTDKLSMMLASDSLTMGVVFTNSKFVPLYNAIDDGLLWQLDDYIGDYSNLMRLGDIRFNMARRNGKLMGVPRTRDLVRQGIIYRSDWAEDLGIKGQPKTLEDIETMLAGFTSNGVAKFGMFNSGVSGSGAPQVIPSVAYMAVYLGAPLEYGYDSKGNFTYSWLTDEYFEAVKLNKKWYDAGYMNKNFMESIPNNLVTTEEAGMTFAFCDDITRYGDLYTKNPDAKLWYAYEINGRTFATWGVQGQVSFSKKEVKDEETLRHCLTFLDALSSDEGETFFQLGIEGLHYTLQDGVGVRTEQAQQDSFAATVSQYSQIRCAKGEKANIPLKREPVVEAQREERLLYEKTAITDLSAPFVSETQGLVSADITPIMVDAINKYIIGAINEDQYKEAQQKWLDLGGAKIIEEFKAQYEASKN